MIRKILILLICAIPMAVEAQRDVLVITRRGMHEKAFTVGDPMTFETIYGQWFSGTIEDLHHDTVYISGQAFNYNEIGAIRRSDNKGELNGLGIKMMVAGAGLAVISAVNGALRQDHPNQWFTTSGYIISGALLAGGFILAELRPKTYKLGGRFKLTYLQISK
ncbi:MAG TPA: hypothetical protein VMH27_19465 [Puia sp.]|nr:hypothetical protein [Puia sp.]